MPEKTMKKRTLSLLLALSLACSLLCLPAFAALPQGWWPVWEAYEKASEGGADDATLLAKGDAVINFYDKFERTDEIANQLFVIYRDRYNRQIYENMGDWSSAIANTKALEEICRYQIGIGNSPETYSEWLPTCAAHLSVLEPFADVYAASYTQSKTYGSKYAASSGTYYGTPHEGCYGDGSIVSFYVNLEEETAETYAHYIEPKADGQRVILLNLKFKGEGSTARAIPSGTYDASLRTTLSYLATLSGPVLVRIGAEPNVWEDKVTPSDFIAAYNYVARMARSLAPKAELVWSPNCASGWNVNTADFYPDNSLVDWVGLSLYYNYTNPGGSERQWLEYIRAGRFADPVGNASEVVEIARAKGKPVIVTEGGTVEYGGVSNYKAKQIAKEFSTLTMVYPEVKAVVYFDKVYNGNDYRLTGSVKSAADAAIAANPTLIASGERSAATYVPLTQFNEKVNGALVLGATGRTYRNFDMSAVWKLDDKQIASASGSPNQCRIELSALTAGSHKLEVTLSDGGGYTVTKTYTLANSNGTVKASEGWTAPAPQPAPAPAAEPEVQPTAQNLTVNGEKKSTEIYTIDGYNYFKLRDMAALLSGTTSQFSVDFDGARNTIVVKTGAAYESVGGELSIPSESEMRQKAAHTVNGAQKVEIDGRQVDLTAFNIGGNNFFKLRDLGDALSFNVDWDGATATMLVSSK